MQRQRRILHGSWVRSGPQAAVKADIEVLAYPDQLARNWGGVVITLARSGHNKADFSVTKSDPGVAMLRAFASRKPHSRTLITTSPAVYPLFRSLDSQTIMQAVFSSVAAAPVACATKAVQAPVSAKPVVASRKVAAPKAAVSNSVSARQMLVWEPTNNKQVLTFLVLSTEWSCFGPSRHLLPRNRVGYSVILHLQRSKHGYTYKQIYLPIL